MARIVIVRSNEYNINRFRAINLYLNGKKLGEVYNDEAIEFDVPKGEHKLVAKIDWCGSPELNFNISSDNSTETFSLSDFKHSKILMPFTVGLVLLHLIMSVFFHQQLSIFFILPLLLLLIFYISIGRNQYLTLEAKDHGDELSAERVK